MITPQFANDEVPAERQLMRSTWVVVFKLVFAELLALALYLVLRWAGDAFGFADVLLISGWAMTLVKAGILSLLEIVIVTVIVTQWSSNYYILRRGELVFVQGFFKRRQRIYNITNVQNVMFEQSLPGRIFNYGTVLVFSPALKQDLILTEVSNPQKIVSLIGEFARDEAASMAYLYRR